MKNVLSNGITSSSQQPYTYTTHEWYNAMSKDVAEAFVKSLIPSSAYTGKLVILSGCALTGSNFGARTVADGWVWYNGEIFRVNAGSFTTTVSQIGIWSINTVSSNLIFSDGASKPVHQERTFVITNGASGSGLFDEGSSNVIAQSGNSIGQLQTGVSTLSAKIYLSQLSIGLTSSYVRNTGSTGAILAGGRSDFYVYGVGKSITVNYIFDITLDGNLKAGDFVEFAMSSVMGFVWPGEGTNRYRGCGDNTLMPGNMYAQVIGNILYIGINRDQTVSSLAGTVVATVNYLIA